MGGWIAFWDSNHSIYVNARHRDAHFRVIADDIVKYIPSPDAVVLDYGCGEALHADRVAAAAWHLILIEAAPSVRARLTQRFGHLATVGVRAPEALGKLADGSVDVVILNSVAQYLTADALDEILRVFRRLVAPGGVVVIGDVVPPSGSAAIDVLALLRFAAAEGFLGAAIIGVARTAMSDYRRLRSRLGLTRYTEGAFIAKLAAAGFKATRAPRNIGHNPTRMTFLAKPANGE